MSGVVIDELAMAMSPLRPHIVAILADDYGWGNVGYHRSTPTREIVTPNIDALVGEGVELTRHCMHREARTLD